MWWWLSAAQAAAPVVVAVGDGLVATPAAAVPGGSTPSPSGWVASLEDCLLERAGQKGFSVVDRINGGETATSALEKAKAIGELGPAVIVVGVGSREFGQENAEVARFKLELEALVEALKPKTRLVLLSLIPPTASQLPAPSPTQLELTEQIRPWNQSIAAVAKSKGLAYVDLFAGWPTEVGELETLTVQGLRLSDKGHARIGTTVCDAVLQIAKP